MKSDRAKVLQRLCGVSMIRLAAERALKLRPKSVVVVVGHDAAAVKAEVADLPIRFAFQRQQLGTGHAARVAMSQLKEAQGHVLILYGDTPLLRVETLQSLTQAHSRGRASLSLITATLEPAGHYGRIQRTPEGSVSGIVEARDATPEQLRITEFNPGIYCARVETLRRLLPRLNNRNAQKEYLLTDVLALVHAGGEKIVDVRSARSEEVLGVNTLQELAASGNILRQEKLNQLMSSGVLILDPSNTYIDWHCQVGAGTVLHPQVQLEGSTRIAENCRIRSFSRITDCRLDADVTVLENSVLVDSSFGSGTHIGPSAHVRAGSAIGCAVRIGNYVEVKNCRIGDETKAAHLTYLGDATIGKDVNIGAGTITCNYDGVRKNPSWIEDNAFIGSDSQLIAPVRIGAGAYVAAGSTITEDVPADALAIARGRQVIKPGWAKERRAVIAAEKRKLRRSNR